MLSDFAFAYQKMSLAQNVQVVLVIFAQVLLTELLIERIEVGLPSSSKAFKRLPTVAMVTKRFPPKCILVYTRTLALTGNLLFEQA